MTENEILDQDPNKKEVGNPNSKLSLWNLIFTCVILLLFTLSSLFEIQSWESESSIEWVQSILIVILLISIISGFSFALRSLLKKEDNSIIKIIGLIGNFTLFTFFLGMIAFLVSDLFRLFN